MLCTKNTSRHTLFAMSNVRNMKSDGTCCQEANGSDDGKPLFGGSVEQASIDQIKKRVANHEKSRTKGVASGDNTDAFILDPFIFKGPTAGGKLAAGPFLML